MPFLIAQTFTDALGRLPSDEQKLAKTTAFDLQLNPAAPGNAFHRLDHARDKNFWSVRVGSDLRIIVHRTADSLLLCYVDHHDKAYAWAERRKLATHPTTGAAQLIEVRETVEEHIRAVIIDGKKPVAPQIPPFLKLTDIELLAFGVPPGDLADVRSATEETLLELADRLPAEAAEALLELATGGKPKPRPTAPSGTDPFAHPDAQRRFRIMGNVDELRAALDAPWDQWIVFLHPDQRQLIERVYTGPARVAGSAGTGKTIVALHRAAFLARTHPEARVLLTTFSQSLAKALLHRLNKLIASEPRLAERLDVMALDTLAERMYGARFGRPDVADSVLVRQLAADAVAATGNRRFSLAFVTSEWSEVVDAWQLRDWAAYRDVKRLGRKTRLPEVQRTELWAIFEHMLASLQARGLTTQAALLGRLTGDLEARSQSPYEFAVVDEAQDISIAQLRFLAALSGGRPEALFFAGDLGQRIFQQPFSWSALGVDVRGRSRVLHVNYRTSHQIRGVADRLLTPSVADVDGVVEDRKGTVSVFNGPQPTVKCFGDEAQEAAFVGNWVGNLVATGLSAAEIAIFVRSEAQLPRAESALNAAGLPFVVLDRDHAAASGRVTLATMHLAKGLEFRAVAVMACEEDVVPLLARIESVGDNADLAEVYATERHLLYVACTRARDHLLVTAGGEPSEFLGDLSR